MSFQNFFDAIDNSQQRYDDLRYQEIIDWVNSQSQYEGLRIELSFLVLGWELTLKHEKRSYPLASFSGYRGNIPSDEEMEQFKKEIAAKIELAIKESFSDWSSELIASNPHLRLVAKDYAVWLDVGLGFEALKWSQHKDKVHATGLHSGYYSQPCNPCAFTREQALAMIQMPPKV
jgi:hypothetical protein